MSSHAPQVKKDEESELNAVLTKKPAPPPPPPPAAAQTVTPDPVKPGEKRNTDHAEPWVDPKRRAVEDAFAKPSAAIVDGVPTGAVARADDDDATFSTETTVKGPVKYSNDKKKYQKASEATHSLERATTTTNVEGDLTTTKTKTTGAKGNWKDKTAGVNHSRAESVKTGEGENEKTVTTTRSGGVDVGLTGGTANYGKETSTKIGDGGEITKGRSGTAGYKDGHVVAEYGTTNKTTIGGTTREKGRTIGLNEGELTGGLSSKRTDVVGKDGDGNDITKSRGTSATFGVGLDSVSAGAAHSRTSTSGTTTKVAGSAKIDGKGNASLSGTVSAQSKDGNSISVSAKVGTSVETGDIVEENGTFTVVYKRAKTKAGGIGGSYKGMGASASASHDDYDMGQRTFKTRAEAEDFKKNAAVRIQKESPNPRTLAGVMSMEIGETVGHGDATTKSAGISASYQSMSVGLSKSSKETDEMSVRRVSANVFEVTTSHGGLQGRDFNIAGAGIGRNVGSSDSEGSARTYRFDLATPEGQAAFTLYQSTGIVPLTGAKQVSSTSSKAEESHDGISVFGLLNDVYSKDSWESTTYNESGKHEEYGGRTSHVITTGRIGHWLGDKNITEHLSLVGTQKDDKIDGYKFEAIYGGESGNNNRRKLADLVGDYDDYKPRGDKSSGEWKLTASASTEAVDQMMNNYDRLKNIKDPDAKQRALAEMLKENGAGVAHAIDYTNDAAGQLAWNVELKGDKNFPGEKGRAEHEAKIKAYAELMKISIGSPQVVVNQLQGEIASLEARRAAVADEKKYTDLPNKLRMMQLELIDSQIRELQAIRHPGLVELSKNNLGESNEDIAKRFGDEKGYDHLPPHERELAKIQDEISMLDAELGKLESDNMLARRAISHAMDNYVDEDRAKEVGGRNRRDAQEKLELGRLVDDNHRHRSIGYIDDMRAEFLMNMAQPNVAKAYGNSLRNALREEVVKAKEAGGYLRDSAHIQSKVNKDKSLHGKHATFWQGIEDDEFELPVYVDPNYVAPVSLTLPE
jgi:hypothetical protein